MRRWTVLTAALALSACDGSGGRGTGATTSHGGTTSTSGSGTTSSGGTSSSGGTTVNVMPGQTTGTTGSTTSGNNCGVQNFMLNRTAIPDLMIVQDRSGSMMADPDGSGGFSSTPSPTSKWVQMVTALEQVVASITTIDWGLLMFPEVGQDNNNFGCTVGMNPDVNIGTGTGPAIKTALDKAVPGGTTPTAAAINSAVAAMTQKGIDSDGHPRYILLATDGEPDCSTDAAMMDDPVTDTDNAVKAAVAAGMHVFVVGIGTDPTDQMTLTNLANEGMEPNKTPGESAYYQVSSTMDLVNTLNKIAGQIVSCNYALQSAPDHPDLVTIQSDGMDVPHDTTHMNGWDFGPMNLSIVFYGTACNDLQNGVTQMVQAVYGCPPVS
jgi:hypothetical protein